jgi:sigma-54 dependent transcriptional regulator, acetoin dehydrogenase operon transcriptional activator AcoR
MRSQHVDKVISIVEKKTDSVSLGVNGSVAQSWSRCLQKYGIDPSSSSKVQILTDNELKKSVQRLDTFLNIAKAGTQYLYRQVMGLGYSVLLSDANGVTVDWHGDSRLDKEWKRAGLYLGAVWSEVQEGTSGAGTVLVEKRPLTIHKGEHYRAQNTNLTCSAAPIFDTRGKVLAALDVSSFTSPDSKDSQHLALQLVTLVAHKIESAYFLSQFEDRWVLRISRARELAEVGHDCLLAVDGQGKILAADRGAEKQFGSNLYHSLVGRYISEVFDLNFEKLLTFASNSGLVWSIRTLNSGLQFFASLRLPRAIQVKPVQGSVSQLAAPVKMPEAGRPLSLDYLAGSDPQLKAAVDRIKRVMNKPISIILNGETGTGKEMFAQAIHNASHRADKPFVAVNCAAIPESLIESELFGYEKGAFTGARSKGMSGTILQSNGGTLFLDEIGDMPANLQPRLLRVLAEQEVTPLGGETPIPVDLHVICATHRNILDMVANGEFREDLYYRLNGVSFELTPLRQRSDIARLINDVLILEAGNGVELVTIEDEAMRIMSEFSWPGNIRQLRNALRYALAVCDKGIITCADLPSDVMRAPEPAAKTGSSRSGQAVPSMSEKTIDTVSSFALDEKIAGLNAMEQAERQVILDALQKHKWQVSKAVKEVGIVRTTMYRKMRKYAIVSPYKS